ncbi:DNA-processing protein DprA [Microbacterium sp. X-17]|uniref:DNA-processing protein DprA n=1 Tax=Microbacterium sp. X-17 TaxID=3144404 RepID=UPI0031F50711
MSLRLSASLAVARLHRVVDGSLDGDAALSRYARAVWSVLAEPGDGVAGRLVAAVGPVRALEIAQGAAAPPETDAAELARGRARWAPRLDDVTVGEAFDQAGASGVRLLVPEDAEWPTALDDLGEHAPACLWLRGDPARLADPAPTVAIVGARASTSYGDHVAWELASDLAAGGVTVVSGAAYGIDGAAHRAALGVAGVTVALLAGGVDRPYPADHGPLVQRITQTGVVASEVPCGTSPTKWRFLARNRLIAALARATVVVEAGWRSGSLNTAGHAATLGRALGAVPGPITSAASAGCHRLLREYDAQCITDADDVRELLGIEPAAAIAAPSGGSSVRTRVEDAVSTRAWRETADIARRSGLSVADAQAALGLLELEGAAERSDLGWRLRR